MAEIRFPVKDRFNEKILKLCEELGISKAEYVKNLIINDLKNKEGVFKK